MMRSPRRRAISMRVATLVALLALSAPAAAHGHTVLPGETLSGIAAANGISTQALAAANGLSPTSFAIAGTTLTIPAAGSAVTAPAAPTAGSAAPGAGGHLVSPGETLTGIAAANGITPAALAAANGLSPTSFVIAGTRLRIPAAGAPSSCSCGQPPQASSAAGRTASPLQRSRPPTASARPRS
jgi:LysM repeat protein